MLDQYNDILTIDEVCEILKIGRGYCYKLLHSGGLKAFQLGKTWKIPREAVEEYITTSGYKDKDNKNNIFDARKIRHSYDLSIGTLISELQKEDLNAKVHICGDAHVVIHVTENGDMCLDNEFLLDCYPDEYYQTFKKENVPVICPIIFEDKIEF